MKSSELNHNATEPRGEMHRRVLTLIASPGKAAVENADAARVHNSLLAKREKRCLEWLARRMPRWVTSDHLTLLGLLAMLLAGASYAAARWWSPSLLIVNVWLAVNWFGDSLDGTLARVRKKERPRYGYYVDHIIDTLGSMFVLGGLALSGYMSPVAALCALVGFYLLSINVYLAAYSRRVFKLSFWKFGPTELRILLAIGNMVALDRQYVRIFGDRHLFFDVAGVISVLGMLVVFLISAVANTVALYREERI
jgi:phosphatidylglycerophosphate synthase